MDVVSNDQLETAEQDVQYRLLLFVAGKERNSRLARENIERFCEQHLPGRFEIQVIDVFTDFQKALEYRVLITPATVVVNPPPQVRIAGSLEDTDRICAALSLPAPV
jgi:circadian clock protein KaiB